tara:strand:+ start:195 stop:428 length:234 start_codon:yes stop_codon:yes gene_type:complete
MSIESLRELLGWCSLINGGLLVIWFLLFILGFYNFQSKWFSIPELEMNKIHIKGMTYFKLSICMFNLAPYIVLSLLQ